MNNRSERGVSQGEKFTRRELLKITGLAAALVLAGGCDEIDIPQTTGFEGNGKPQVPEPQEKIDIDEGTVYNALVLYLAGVVLFGAAALFPPKVR